MTDPVAPRFSPALFSFLRGLAADNDKAWFEEHRSEYDANVKEPALDFIEAFRPRLHSISPHFEANARVNGGSLFRIHRDTRFSKDKTPYKTNTGMHFRHERAKDVHSPGFYLHLEPRNCFMGVGIYKPETKVAYTIREMIAAEPDRWQAITGGDFADTFALMGDSLKRPPKGFDPDHPLIDDLKRKDFIASATLTQSEVTATDFADRFEALCRAGGPFMAFLCEAVGVDY